MTNSPFQEVLSILREHQESQLEMNRSLIEALPPEVRARIPEDYMTLLEYGYAFVYADAIAYCRNLVAAEKEKQESAKFTGVMIVPDEPGVVFNHSRIGPVITGKFRKDK